jgi:acetyl-CoA carboxylase carboxyl transferase subunit beta
MAKPPKAESPKVEPQTAPAPKPHRERGGWLARFAPGVRNLVAKPSTAKPTPENLWVKDPDTGEMIYRPDLELALWVTPGGRHMRIRPALRFAYTFDEGAYSLLPTPSVPDDPLSFVDDRAYVDRLKSARHATGERDAMALAHGKIGGVPTVVLVQDFAFMGGSLGMAAGEGFIAACQTAVKRGSPLVVFTAAGGARMQEGALSLMQMARTTLAIQDLKAARLPYIVVLTDPTTGGVTASYAMLGDIHLAEPGAMIGFAGPRVIEETIRETLPPGFQRSEYLLDKGMVDRVTPRKDLPNVLASILGTLMMGRSVAA